MRTLESSQNFIAPRLFWLSGSMTRLGGTCLIKYLYTALCTLIVRRLRSETLSLNFISWETE